METEAHSGLAAAPSRRQEILEAFPGSNHQRTKRASPLCWAILEMMKGYQEIQEILNN